jgi:hypothetical protein
MLYFYSIKSLLGRRRNPKSPIEYFMISWIEGTVDSNYIPMYQENDKSVG